MSDHTISHNTANGRTFVGALLVFCGMALWVMLLLDAGYGLPISLPRSWYEHRTLWGFFGVVSILAGWVLQRNPTSGTGEWSPGVRGKRFRRLIVYSRPECHLCDDAKAVLANYLDSLPEIEDIDIDHDPELKEQFGTTIPVVELDGQIRFRGRVDEILLRRLIEGTPPLDEFHPE